MTLACSVFIFMLANAVSANGELAITNLVITPQPVVAGQNFTISFQLYDNAGSLTNVDIGLTGSYPLLNYSPSNTVLISGMSQGLYGGTTTYFAYKIRVPPNTQSGTYTMYLSATYQVSSTSASSNIPISFYISGNQNLALSASPTSPIVPGQQFNVNINALNAGTAQVTNSNITLLNSPNFSIVGASTFNLGTIQADASAIAVATLQANNTLMQGVSSIPLILRYTTQYGKIMNQTLRLPVSIVVSQPNLIPSITTAQPQLLYSGSNQTLTVSVQNIGIGVAKNVSLRFLTTQYLTVGNSATGIFIGSIQAGSSSTETVFITANKNDNLTSYQLPIQLTYSNANYQNPVSKTAYLNITLQNAARFNITRVNDSLSAGATYSPIIFAIKNTGSEAAQQMTVSLQTIYPISPVNPNVYISNLAPGQSTNVTFYVNVDGQGNTGQYPVTLYEQWTQPNGATNQQYAGSSNYYATLYPQGASSKSFTYPIIGIVIVAVIAFVAYSRMKKTKKLNNMKK